ATCLFFASRRRQTMSKRDWSSDVCSSDLIAITLAGFLGAASAAESFSDVIVEAVIKTGIRIPENLLNSIVVFLITLIISFINIEIGRASCRERCSTRVCG